MATPNSSLNQEFYDALINDNVDFIDYNIDDIDLNKFVKNNLEKLYNQIVCIFFVED